MQFIVSNFLKGCLNSNPLSNCTSVKVDKDGFYSYENGKGTFDQQGHIHIEIEWRKVENTIHYKGRVKYNLLDTIQCANTNGLYGSGYNLSIKKVIEKFGKKETDFDISGEVLQEGKDVFFSLKGIDSNPIPGKEKAEFVESKTKEKMCWHPF